MAADGAGISFGQYVLLRRIARGGMAEVFLAQQRGFGGFDRRVAIKRILPHLADAPDFIQMFLGEAKLAAQLSHPNIVHIYDFGKVEADYFIAMEYVDGVDAGELFRRGGEAERLSPALVARLGADAAAALHYAHELRAPSGTPYGLVHRDVSPANLMVSFDGVVKLCDFGIAKAAAIGDRLTAPGLIKGKYAYMSPEQTTGKPLDGRSDVYSLAVVMWELLTGKTLVPRGDVIEAMRAIRDGRFPSVDRAAPLTPPPLARAITWALQTDAQHRPTAMQLAQALEAFIKSSPELATSMQLGSWLRAHIPRDHAGQGASQADGGTQSAPGTQAAPGTGALASDSLIAASRVGNSPMNTSETTAETAVVAPADRVAQAVTVIAGDRGQGIDRGAGAPPLLGPREPPWGAGAAQAETVIAGDGGQGIDRGVGAPRRPGPTEPPWGARGALAPAGPPGGFPGDDAETVMRDGALPSKVPGGPSEGRTLPGSGPAPVMRGSPAPVMRGSSVPVMRSSPVSAMPPSPGRLMTGPAQGRLPGRARAFAGLIALAVLSFVMVLATRGKPPPGVAPSPIDAAVAPAAPEVASGAASGVPPGAAPDAALPVDAAPIDVFVPTIPPDADTTAVLEIRTRPDGAMVKIGDRSEAAPTQFALPAGHYVIEAELDGWMPERRDIDLVRGQRVVQEIVFTTELPHSTRRARKGRLTVRTTPSCKVFLGTRSLGETPLTELELDPGAYTLSFTHPRHATVVRNVTIAAGKTTKLQFTLP